MFLTFLKVDRMKLHEVLLGTTCEDLGNSPRPYDGKLVNISLKFYGCHLFQNRNRLVDKLQLIGVQNLICSSKNCSCYWLIWTVLIKQYLVIFSNADVRKF